MNFRFGALTGLVLVCALSACAVFDSAPSAKQRTGVIPGNTITVSGHQTVYAIAQANGVSMRDIILLNNLHQPFAVKSGQSLVLPFKRGDVASNGTTSEFVPAEPGGSMQAAPLGAIETETLPPPQPSVVQHATLQPVQQQQQSKQKLGGVAPVEALNTPTSVAPLKQVATTMAPPPVQAAAAASSTASSAVTAPPPAMIWPVQGPLLSGFGPKGQGVNNDGVNIGAPKGSPVVAAANGIVVYAGNEMKGFGNLVLIRHEGGWVTAYAYLDRVLVTKDAVVAQGDMIGTVGKSGNIATPQLHFETRQGGKVVDPSGIIKG